MKENDTKQLINLLKEWIEWEAQFILDNECWSYDDIDFPVFNQKMYDSYLELMDTRQKVLNKFGE